MNAKVRYLIVVAAAVFGGVWLLSAPRLSPPPDFTDQGFTSVRVELKCPGSEESKVSASSDDPALVAELVALLRSGQPVVVCRCAALGTLEFRRPDGTSERVLIMPAHGDNAVEVRVPARGRYRLDRERFLQLTGPLGIPAARWHT